MAGRPVSEAQSVLLQARVLQSETCLDLSGSSIAPASLAASAGTLLPSALPIAFSLSCVSPQVGHSDRNERFHASIPPSRLQPPSHSSVHHVRSVLLRLVNDDVVPEGTLRVLGLDFGDDRLEVAHVLFDVRKAVGMG